MLINIFKYQKMFEKWLHVAPLMNMVWVKMLLIYFLEWTLCCRYWQDLEHKFAYYGVKMMDWIFVRPIFPPTWMPFSHLVGIPVSLWFIMQMLCGCHSSDMSTSQRTKFFSHLFPNGWNVLLPKSWRYVLLPWVKWNVESCILYNQWIQDSCMKLDAVTLPYLKYYRKLCIQMWLWIISRSIWVRVVILLQDSKVPYFWNFSCQNVE